MLGEEHSKGSVHRSRGPESNGEIRIELDRLGRFLEVFSVLGDIALHRPTLPTGLLPPANERECRIASPALCLCDRLLRAAEPPRKPGLCQVHLFAGKPKQVTRRARFPVWQLAPSPERLPLFVGTRACPADPKTRAGRGPRLARLEDPHGNLSAHCSSSRSAGSRPPNPAVSSASFSSAFSTPRFFASTAIRPRSSRFS